jgi:hypothetical protein|eukprot:COSAG01_NODE_3836_length_5649_cov_1.967748_4_plen_318_part_00
MITRAGYRSAHDTFLSSPGDHGVKWQVGSVIHAVGPNYIQLEATSNRGRQGSACCGGRPGGSGASSMTRKQCARGGMSSFLSPCLTDCAAHVQILINAPKSADTLLRRAYEKSLQLAAANGIEYLGFSLLSTGIFRGSRPLTAVLQVAFDAVAAYQPVPQHIRSRAACCATPQTPCHHLREVHLVAYEHEQLQLLLDIADAHQAAEPPDASCCARYSSVPEDLSHTVVAVFVSHRSTDHWHRKFVLNKACPPAGAAEGAPIQSRRGWRLASRRTRASTLALCCLLHLETWLPLRCAGSPQRLGGSPMVVTWRRCVTP